MLQPKRPSFAILQGEAAFLNDKQLVVPGVVADAHKKLEQVSKH